MKTFLSSSSKLKKAILLSCVFLLFGYFLELLLETSIHKSSTEPTSQSTSQPILSDVHVEKYSFEGRQYLLFTFGENHFSGVVLDPNFEPSNAGLINNLRQKMLNKRLAGTRPTTD